MVLINYLTDWFSDKLDMQENVTNDCNLTKIPWWKFYLTKNCIMHTIIFGALYYAYYNDSNFVSQQQPKLFLLGRAGYMDQLMPMHSILAHSNFASQLRQKYLNSQLTFHGINSQLTFHGT